METIIVLSRKGGVGKTSTAHALGAALRLRKKKVLFVDADGQCNLTLSMKAHEDDNNLYDVFKKKCSIREAIQKTDAGDIVPGNEKLQTIDYLMQDKEKSKGHNTILREALKKVSKDYDYCVIDTPASLETVTMNCIVSADKVIVPLQADIYSMQGIVRIIDALNYVKEKYNNKLELSGFLLTRYSSRAVLSRQIAEELQKEAKKYNSKLYKTKIRECIAIKECAVMQKDIFTYAPKSNGAIDYDKFVKEFLKK